MEPKYVSAVAGRALGCSIVGAFLFALGGVATWMQEYVVWLSHRAASLLVMAGLALGLTSVLLLLRLLFRGPPLERPQVRQVACAVFFATLPPVVFLAWVVWLRLLMNGRL